MASISYDVLRRCCAGLRWLCAGAFAAGWISYFAAAHMGAQRTALMMSRPRPVAINGFRVELEGLTEHLATCGHRITPTATLLLAVDDTCNACRVAVPHMLELFRSVRWSDDNAVRIVSFRGHGLAKSLAAALEDLGAHFTIDTARSPAALSRVGILGTPWIFLLDKESHVRQAPGGVGERDALLLVRALNSPHEWTAEAPISSSSNEGR